MGYMKFKWNTSWLGLVIGLLTPLIILLGMNVFKFAELGFGEFLVNAFEQRILATWLKIAVLINLAPFFLALNTNRYKLARAILMATILYGLFIIYLSFT